MDVCYGIRRAHPSLLFPYSHKDDFLQLERIWADLAQRTFREPRPKIISTVMRRVRDEWRTLHENILPKLVHVLPIKWMKFFVWKGRKIPLISFMLGHFDHKVRISIGKVIFFKFVLLFLYKSYEDAKYMKKVLFFMNFLKMILN